MTTVLPTGFGGFLATSSPRSAAYVFAWLGAADFERQLAGSWGRWVLAGGDLAHQVLNCVQANQKSILAERK